MNRYILLTLMYYSVNGFNILSHYIPSSITKEFYTCPSINDKLRETTIQVIDDINKYNTLFISLKDETSNLSPENGINEICNTDTQEHYGFTNLFGTDETDIHISNSLLYKTNTLYNVVYHEFLHALGLNHTEEQSGYMNYKIQTNRYGITEDNRKLYPSLDDIKGLRYIKNNLLCPT